MGPADPAVTLSAPLQSEPLLSVEVAVSVAPRQVARALLKMAVGATVRDALLACGLMAQVPGLSPEALNEGRWAIAVWGRKERLDHVLRDRDRIELVRPLLVDPKEARRVRYRAHLAKWPKGSQRIKPRKKASIDEA